MGKKKKDFIFEPETVINEVETQVEEKKEIRPIKKKIDFSVWTYKQMLEYCEENKISTLRLNPQQIRTMLQKRN